MRSRNPPARNSLRLLEAPAPSHLRPNRVIFLLYDHFEQLTPGPGLCDCGTLDLFPKKGFLERDCFCSDSELSPTSSSSFFFPPIENLRLILPRKSFFLCYLVIFLRVVLNMLPVVPGPFSPGGEFPPPPLPSVLALEHNCQDC